MWLMMNKHRIQIVCFVLLAAISWTLGYGMARSVYQTKISSLKAEHIIQAAQREQQHVAQIQAALSEQQKWQQFAQQQGLALAQAQQQLDIQAARQQKAIPHALQKDRTNGTVYNGIGTRSLQEYNRAFGYTD